MTKFHFQVTDIDVIDATGIIFDTHMGMYHSDISLFQWCLSGASIFCQLHQVGLALNSQLVSFAPPLRLHAC